MFLYSLPKDHKNCNFFLLTEFKDLFSCSKQMLEHQVNNKNVYLMRVETNLRANSSFTLKLKIKGILGTTEYADNSTRTTKNFEEEFLFAVNFTNGKNPFNGSLNNDYYCQLFLYLDYCIQFKKTKLLESLFQSFYNLIIRDEHCRESSIEKQGMIVSLANAYYSDCDCDNDLEGFFRVLSILGLIQMLLSDEINLKLSNWPKMINNIEKNIIEIINKFKLNVNYKIAIKGIAKIYALARIKNMNITMLFYKINDQKTSGDFILNYIQNLGNFKIFITTIELKNILNHIESFDNDLKIRISNQILEFPLGLEQLIELLLHPVLKNKLLLEKRKFFFSALMAANLNNEGLLSFLILLKDKNVYNQRLFNNIDITNFLNRHLITKNIALREFPVIINILRLIQNEEELSGFKISDFLINIVSLHSFKNCIDLLLLAPGCIPDIFRRFNQIKFSPNNPNEYYNKIQTDLEPFSKTIQEKILFSIIDKLAEQELKDQLQHIYKNENELIKNTYKKVFIQKLLNFSNSDEYQKTVEFILSQRTLNINKENFILNYLLIEAQNVFTISKKDFTNLLIKNPKRGKFLLEFIKSYDRKYNLRSFEQIFTIIEEKVEKIMNKNIKVKNIVMIYDNDNAIFFEYAKYVLKGLAFQEFSDIFFNIHENIKMLKENLRKIEKFISNFHDDFFKTLNKPSCDYKTFLLEMNELRVSEFVLPTSLIWIENLLIFPLKSTIFVNYIHKKSETCSNNYDDYFLSAQNFLSKFLNSLKCNQENEYSLDDIISIVGCMDRPNKFDKEFEELSKCFPQIFNPYLKERLFELFQVTISFKDFKPLLTYLKITKETFSLPNEIYKNYLVTDITRYTNDFSCSVLNMAKDELNLLNRKEKYSLIIFLEQVAKSIKLINLISSLEEEDISFWHESFDECLNHNISLNLIQEISVIWSFLSIIKQYKSSLQSFFMKIVNLIKVDKYSYITELISQCSQRFNALDEFNKSLNNQEQAKLNKIKIICTDSLLRIISRESFSAEIVVANMNKVYSSDPISLNDLTELRERALLSRSIINQQKEKNQTDRSSDLIVYDQFVMIIDTVCKFVSVLDQLQNSLFRESCKEDYKFYISNGNFEQLKNEFIKHENYLNQIWKSAIKEFYKKSYLINFLNGENIYLIDKFVFHRSEENLEKILKVLIFMNKESPKKSKRKKNPPQDLCVRLRKIEKFLNGLKNRSRLIQSSIKLVINTKTQGSILLVETKEFYKGVLTIYTNYQKTLPRSDLVFFCHFSTDWLEIKRFLNRCSLNPDEEIYTLVYPERLSLENQIKVDSKLYRLVNKKCIFSLAIITNDLKSKLINNLLHNPIIKIEKIQNLAMLSDDQIKNLMENLAPNIVVVTSAYVVSVHKYQIVLA